MVKKPGPGHRHVLDVLVTPARSWASTGATSLLARPALCHSGSRWRCYLCILDFTGSNVQAIPLDAVRREDIEDRTQAFS